MGCSLKALTIPGTASIGAGCGAEVCAFGFCPLRQLGETAGIIKLTKTILKCNIKPSPVDKPDFQRLQCRGRDWNLKRTINCSLDGG
jgi:hypothetical protein